MNKQIIYITLFSTLILGCKNDSKEKDNIIQEQQKESLKGEPEKNDEVIDYEKLGMDIAMSVQEELGKTLTKALQEDDINNAIKFCNEAAYSITDSMSVVYSASIKRVSDKHRNPNNRAKSKERFYINKFKKKISDNKEVKPIVEYAPKSVNFFYPIITNTLCLQCHGKNIDNNVYNTIKRLYPNDKAIEYSENEVRGMWSISFSK